MVSLQLKEQEMIALQGQLEHKTTTTVALEQEMAMKEAEIATVKQFFERSETEKESLHKEMT